MKPVLIIPPAPARWPMLEDLYRHKGQPWLADIERRLIHGVPGAQDVYAVIPAGGQALAGVCVNKFGDVGVLGHCYTRPEHRRRGYGRRLMETVLSWFDMTGGKWLFLGTTAELDEGLYRKFGFLPLRRIAWSPYDRLTMLRRGRGAAEDPYAGLAGEVAVRDVTRAEWPALVAMLQYHPGPDPRVPLDESAVTAEAFTLDLIGHAERGVCGLQGAFHGPRPVGLATIATDRTGERTYGMLIPHTDAPPELPAAAIEFARSKGYTQVEFPMEALRPTTPPPPPPQSDPAAVSAPPA
jgi:GNAT superfamily N-acetyltransferase